MNWLADFTAPVVLRRVRLGVEARRQFEPALKAVSRARVVFAVCEPTRRLPRAKPKGLRARRADEGAGSRLELLEDAPQHDRCRRFRNGVRVACRTIQRLVSTCVSAAVLFGAGPQIVAQRADASPRIEFGSSIRIQAERACAVQMSGVESASSYDRVLDFVLTVRNISAWSFVVYPKSVGTNWRVAVSVDDVARRNFLVGPPFAMPLAVFDFAEPAVVAPGQSIAMPLTVRVRAQRLGTLSQQSEEQHYPLRPGSYSLSVVVALFVTRDVVHPPHTSELHTWTGTTPAPVTFTLPAEPAITSCT